MYVCMEVAGKDIEGALDLFPGPLLELLEEHFKFHVLYDGLNKISLTIGKEYSCRWKVGPCNSFGLTL